MDIDEKLAEARRAGRQARLRVSGTLMGIGGVLGSGAMMYWCTSKILNASTRKALPATSLIISALLFPAGALGAVAILPTDVRIIRASVQFSAWAALASAFCFLGLSIVYASGALDQAESLHSCLASWQLCAATMVQYTGLAVLMIATAVFLLPAVAVVPDGTAAPCTALAPFSFWCRSRERRLMSEQKVFFIQVHGRGVHRIVMMAGFPGLCTGFWLAGRAGVELG